jgi:Asp/Glu/hydantoin racemase
LDSLPIVNPNKSDSTSSLTEEQQKNNELERTILDSILSVANRPKPEPVQIESKNEEPKDGKALLLICNFKIELIGMNCCPIVQLIIL